MPLILLFFSAHFASAQDTLYARKVVKQLCASKFHGRGYYKNGAVKASAFIAAEMQKAGLEGISGSYFQTFQFPINVFKGNPYLRINNLVLVPGRDFVVNADAPSSQIETNQAYQVVWVNATNLKDSVFRESCETEPILFYPGKTDATRSNTAAFIYIIDTLPSSLEKQYAAFLNTLKNSANTITFKKDKITWSASPERISRITIEALRPNLDMSWKKPISVRWDIRTELTETSQRNVVGIIKGTRNADSFIVVTAHYDHLGRMGKKSIFPGANDNAAGVAMLLDMARYYKAHPPAFSMVFIAFAGEEAGLIGSGYYVKHPLHELAKTRFVLNCDLVGTGETGITVVNATVFPMEFTLLDSINQSKKYLVSIAKRGKAANSDHYFFSELGIPSFFWYQGGPRRAYHDVTDIPETLTLFGYNATIYLALDFFKALGN